MQKAKKVAIASLAAALVIISSFLVGRALATAPPRQAAEAYLRALASGDTETALKYSSGSAAFAASRLKGNEVTAQVNSVSCSVTALGRGWARVQTTTELTLQDGSADIGWYSLDVVKTGQGWRIVSFREAKPVPEGTDVFFISQADISAAKLVFQDYLNALAAGDWQGAAKFLAGQARRSQEMSQAALGKGVLIGKVEEALTAEPVWGKGKELIVRFDYKVNDRDVSVMVEFHKTVQGWKIAKLIQN